MIHGPALLVSTGAGWVALDDVALSVVRQVATRYYYAGAQRIAQRTNNAAPVWTVGDYLGSTSFSIYSLHSSGSSMGGSWLSSSMV